MTRGSQLFFHDASVLVNFHRPGLVPVLGALLGDQVTWSATVRRECERQEWKLALPGLVAAADELLDEPFYPQDDEHLPIRQLRTQMASAGDHPDEHWGEAETITIIQKRRLRAVFVTDDRGAMKWAHPVQTVGTWRLIRLAHLRGDASLDDAIRLWQGFVDAGGHPPHRWRTRPAFTQWIQRPMSS